jgi:bifunctional oligoribonuclease and PAP phosphatase NrnA
VITPSDYPEFLRWLPADETVINYETKRQQADELISKAEVIFCLDYNWLSRVEQMESILRNSTVPKILIDHHLDPEPVYNFTFSYPDACSTCELVYQFIVASGDKNLVNKNIAECLYCGIMTDTNSFRYSSMKSDTHRIIALLMEAGAENYKIHERVYDTNSENRLRLLGYALKDKLKVLPEFNTAYLALSKNELKGFNFKSGDTEGFVNYALSIEGIKLAAFFSEHDGLIKISFRSKGNFSVKDLSAKYFEGGGHRNASGGRSLASLDDTIARFISILPGYKSELNGK